MRTCQPTAPGPRRCLPVQEPTCTQTPLQGQLLAKRYRAGRVLNIGGMGRVYAGHDEVTGNPVVIKLPQPDAGGACANCVRLEREGRAAAALNNPHLVRFVSAGGLKSEVPFLVLERLDGVDLGVLIKENGPLSVGVAVSYARQACLGLAAMHAAGLVHRDVKPSNLFLCTRGTRGPSIKVIDLGLVKSTRAERGDAQLTGDHMLLGSPSYMSPEQMRQLDLDPRTDVWSLGVVLFELLTGTRPFNGPTIVDVCAQILTQAVPSVRERVPELEPALEAVVLRCLAKDRQDRYGSMLELYEALESFDTVKHEALPQTVTSVPNEQRPAARKAATRGPHLSRWQLALAAAMLLLVSLLLVRQDAGASSGIHERSSATRLDRS